MIGKRIGKRPDKVIIYSYFVKNLLNPAFFFL